ncbi:MAG: OsmC family protein [Armatimonadetes bacterium]|nr:osmotically inducible protein OsmC [Armatimonadota bacterium]MBS1703534.1 OsmC family protein [Armatimonadota bacterium]MBS1729025.1 OsmC family protein [Armatimonadota bacterium]
MGDYLTTVDWKGGMAFEAVPPSGRKLLMDAWEEDGGNLTGPTPVETLLSAIAGCSAMDVISILHKKRQKVTSYRVEVDGERGPKGVYPRPFLSITLRHIVKGENIDPAAVARAVELSDEKYCTVITTLRAAPKVSSEWEIEG